MSLSSYPLDAIEALTPSQMDFLKALPKAELHAHLNGSIPLPVLQQLAREYYVAPDTDSDSSFQTEIERLREGVVLETIEEFFTLFTTIYALTSTREALARVTDAVLAEFLDPIGGEEYPQATYLELRSTPRETIAMTRLEYVETVLDRVERYLPDQAALIVSLDRRMPQEVADECIGVAITLKSRGRRIVGVDICGHPTAGDMGFFERQMSAARAAGLGITVHIAETIDNTPEDTLKLLSFKPNRLGHATFLNEEAQAIVIREKMAVEICLTSNFLCKTVSDLETHHIQYYLKENHPIAICTDDTLPFRTNLLGEYAMLLAPTPYGLGLSEGEVEKIAAMAHGSRFQFDG
ncbi:Metallo-dependent hydrolase [Thelephora terrestris]|uniref:Metallo-dependent hydrolase n=1 Tax=Thelephora terrestris TaxID=56493 RepID=A0A9P6H6W7_9AGAM|nr:Metallo-dependent hydrolase [Thelephora terrestris]